MRAWLGALVALLLVGVLAPQPARAAEPFVTIGLLPVATRGESIMIRGTAPRGSVVDLAVNGELHVRVKASESMDIYRYTVALTPGENRVTATVEGTEVSAQALLYRVTASFPDLQHHWARDDAEILATLGVVNGMGDGSFGPDAPLTRAQFAKLLVLGLGLAPAGEGAAGATLDFADAATVPAWARGYIATAVAQGLIQGNPDNTFRPDAAVSRAEVVAMAARALRLRQVSVEPAELGFADTQATPTFTDAAAIPDWVRPDLAQVAGAGLIERRWWGDAFRAGGPATRGEAAAVVRRLYRYR